MRASSSSLRAMSSSGSLTPSLAQHLVAGRLEDLGARVEVLVDAVAEAHQLERRWPCPWPARCISSAVMPPLVDLLEHLEHCDVRPAVERPPQGADARGTRGEEVGLARADDAHRRGAAILLVVGVQHQDQVQGLDDLRVGDVLLVGHREHHVQEVGHSSAAWGRGR